MFALFKNIVFLAWLVGALVSLSIGLTWWSIHLTASVARVTSEAAAAAVKHRKEVARAVSKTKAKARLKQALVMLPVVGLAAGAYFEEQDYREWKQQNPDGNRRDYACEVAAFTTEVLDEILHDLPEGMMLSGEVLGRQLPNCHILE